MSDELYFKDTCGVYPILKAPVLFILLGERGKEAFPFLRKTRDSMGDSVQMLQIAVPQYKIQDADVEFVDILEAAYKDAISCALENTIIPALKSIGYSAKGMISVNVVVDMDDEQSEKLEEISEYIYSHLTTVFENCVDFYFYCFNAVKFGKEKKTIFKSAVIQSIHNLYEKHKQYSWIKLVYVVSDLNENDIYLSDNLEKKYLALTLNTFLQAGYRVDANAPVFDSTVYADRSCQKRELVFHALGCSPVVLNTELLETYFRWKIVEYFKESGWDDLDTLKNILLCMDSEMQIVEEAFEKFFPHYEENLEYIAYNKNAFGKGSKIYTNRSCLNRLYSNNHQKYYEQNISDVFHDKFRVELEDNKRNLEGRFCKAVIMGEINPFSLDNYKILAEELEGRIHRTEKEINELKQELYYWEDREVSVRIGQLSGIRAFDHIRRKKIREWAEHKRKILIQDGIVRYLHMERNSVLKMSEIALKCRKTAEDYMNKLQSSFSRLERSAFTYQTYCFELYYSNKVNEIMEENITDQEKRRLYISLCEYMLDARNSTARFETEMKQFVKVFCRQGKISRHLTEEIQDRMEMAKQSGTEEVLKQLYLSMAEAKNVDLRVIGGERSGENDICCFAGPSDNELISFLNRYKDKDPRVRVFAVEQLNVPVVLYFKFNIPGNNIRI